MKTAIEKDIFYQKDIEFPFFLLFRSVSVSMFSRFMCVVLVFFLRRGLEMGPTHHSIWNIQEDICCLEPKPTLNYFSRQKRFFSSSSPSILVTITIVCTAGMVENLFPIMILILPYIHILMEVPYNLSINKFENIRKSFPT